MIAASRSVVMWCDAESNVGEKQDIVCDGLVWRCSRKLDVMSVRIERQIFCVCCRKRFYGGEYILAMFTVRIDMEARTHLHHGKYMESIIAVSDNLECELKI